MRRLLVSLALLLLGCSSQSNEPDWHVYDGCRTFVASPLFSEQQYAAIRRASQRWNRIAVEQTCIVRDVVDPRYDQHVIFPIAEGSAYWHQLELRHGPFWGIYFDNADAIGVIDSLAPISVFETVALHEIGHALLGLQHIPPPAIMASYAGTADDFTENDITECFRVHACKPDASVPTPPRTVVLCRGAGELRSLFTTVDRRRPRPLSSLRSPEGRPVSAAMKYESISRCSSPRPLATWERELEVAVHRLQSRWNEIWFGSTQVRDLDGRVIADCTTIEAADAARRLLLDR